MQVNEVTPELLRRIAGARPAAAGGKVLSVYVNLEPGDFATPPARASAITSVLDEAERELRDAPRLDHDARQGLKTGIERVRTFLEQEFDASGAHGVALFCDSGSDLFEAFKLPRGVGHRAVIDDAPFVEPLAGIDAGERFLVVLCNRRAGRLLLGSSEGLREIARLEADDEAGPAVKRVCGLARRRFRDRPLDGVLLGAPDEVIGRLRDELAGPLADRVVGRVEVDVESSSPDQVLAAAGHVLARVRREREDEAIAALGEGLHGGPKPAAARLADVLVPLNEQRVETLLVAAGTMASGRECPACGWLGSAGAECPADGTPTVVREDLVEAMIQRAVLQAADVRIVQPRDGGDTAEQPLAPYGGVGAILRF